MKKLVIILVTLLSLTLVGVAGSTNKPKPKYDHKVTICHKGHTIKVDKHSLGAHFKHGDKLGACKPAPQPEPPIVVPPAPQVNRVLACADKPVFRSADGTPGLAGDVTAEDLARGTFQGAKITIARYYEGVGATCDNFGGSPNGKFVYNYPVWVR